MINAAIVTLAQSSIEPHWYSLRLTDIVMILAVLAAPWLAVHVQRRLDVAREKRARKHAIFSTLMATRGPRTVSADRVTALNQIEIEFYGETKSGRQIQSTSDASVVAAWRVYLDSLDFGPLEDAGFAVRIEQSAEKFVDLLFEMSRSLGYNFDRVLLKKGVYTPVAHSEIDEQGRLIRQGLADILGGKAALSVTPRVPDEVVRQQQDLQAALSGVLSGRCALTVNLAGQPRERHD